MVLTLVAHSLHAFVLRFHLVDQQLGNALHLLLLLCVVLVVFGGLQD